MERSALFSLTYGLFVLSARHQGRDNGCIINTVQQLTDEPLQISVTVNKSCLTHDMIRDTGIFNVSVLDESAPFDLFRRFGFQSGREAEKFDPTPARAENGVAYLTRHCRALLCGQVVRTVDLGTHSLFVAQVTHAQNLGELPAMTYEYYHRQVKPRPQEQEKTVWVCQICGYVYDGEVLPEGYICPWCKHGTEVFEKKTGKSMEKT